MSKTKVEEIQRLRKELADLAYISKLPWLGPRAKKAAHEQILYRAFALQGLLE